MHESKPLSLLTHPCTFYQIKSPFYLVTCRECYWFEIELFTLKRFLPWVPSGFFQGFPGASSSTSKLAGLHADLRNIAQTRLFVWITIVQKIFICGRFNVRVRVGWPWNINLQGAFLLQNISFTKLYFWNIRFLLDLNSLYNRCACYKLLSINFQP